MKKHHLAIIALLLIAGISAMLLFTGNGEEESSIATTSETSADSTPDAPSAEELEEAEKAKKREERLAARAEAVLKRKEQEEAEANAPKEEGAKTKEPAEKPAKGDSGLEKAIDTAKKPEPPAKKKRFHELSEQERADLFRKAFREGSDKWMQELAKDRKGVIQSSRGRPRTRRIEVGPVEKAELPTMKGLWRHLTLPEYPPNNATRTSARVDKQIDFKSFESFAHDASHLLNGAEELNDTWRAVWTGKLLIDERKTLILALGTDLAGSVKLDGKTILLNEQRSWYREVFAEVDLDAGVYELEVVHISGPSPNETELQSSCRFMYKEHWDDKELKPIPASWLFLPDSWLHKPYLASVSPRLAKTGELVTIKGENLLATGRFDEEGNSILLDKNALQLRRSPVMLEVESATNTEIIARIPPGAQSGVLFLQQLELIGNGGSGQMLSTRATSNTIQLDIDEAQGLVVQAWDMTGRGTQVPDPKTLAPDYVRVVADPLEGARSAFPELAGKPMALRMQGQIASIATSYWETNYFTHLHLYWGGGPPESPSSLQAKVRGLTIGVSSSDEAGTVELFKESDPGLERAEWIDVELSTFYEASDEGSFHAALSTNGAPNNKFRRYSNFRPGPNFPSPTSIRDAGSFVRISIMRGKYSNPSIGEEFILLAPQVALENKEYPLEIKVDGQVAPWSYAKDQEGNETRMMITLIDDFGMVQAFTPISIIIPQGAHEGIIEAYQGIIPSKPIDIDIANAGLVGLYYDYDGSLSEIPDNTAKTPVMRRTDKHLNFPSNAAFELPMPAEQFAVEWYGQIYFPEAVEYEFQMQSDDGARVTIAREVVVEFAGLRAPDRSTGKIKLAKGWHDIRIEFFENFGVENFVLKWRPSEAPDPDDPDANEFEHIALQYLRTSYSAGIPDKHPPE